MRHPTAIPAIVDTPILWCDIETTGLDPARGAILEVGFRLTGPDLKTVTEASWVIHHGESVAADLVPNSHPTVRAMHGKNGLWVESALQRRTPSEPRAIREWLTTLDLEGVPLAGSSVHFDAAWLGVHLPAGLDCMGMSHRHVDVSSWREMLQRTIPGAQIIASRPPARKLHRVMPDIDDSIMELAHYMARLGLR